MKSREDILSISLLHEADRLDAWSEWADAAAICLRRSRKVVFDTFSVTMEAAKSGLGAAISSQILVRSNLEKGELVAPFGFVPVNRSIYMFVNGQARNSAAVKQFERWALSEIMSRDDQPSPFEVPTRQIEQAAHSKRPDRPVLASSR
ncbi:LysR substrate-binding domain-containing protein [Bradyrhizobium elkanii]|uniref:LysR substrate-binding domain-containing protein n=1 Tax=Bradyrhizobium elkanii TaxID=29448 RepID=UPI0009BD2DA7